jgi:hypothetical protein
MFVEHRKEYNVILMKKIILTLTVVVLLVTLVSSCKKTVTQLFPGIDAQVPDVVITVPPIPFVIPGEISLGTYSTTFNMDSIIRANTAGVFNANDVSSVKVKTITIAVLNGDNLNNLSNFNYARLTLSSNSNAAEAEIVTINFPQQETHTITVSPTNSPDLRSYLNGNQLEYNVYGQLRRITTKTMDVRVSVTVRIE